MSHKHLHLLPWPLGFALRSNKMSSCEKNLGVCGYYKTLIWALAIAAPRPLFKKTVCNGKTISCQN